jgi:hypothetical protein
MPGGRPRKPIEELKLSGAFKKDPQRLAERLKSPQAIGDLGPAPEYLTVLQKQIWRELCDGMPPGVAGRGDRHAIEIMCRHLATVRKHGLGGKRGLPRGEQSILLQLFGQYGLMAAARQRLTIKEPEGEDSEFTEFDDKLQNKPN